MIGGLAVILQGYSGLPFLYLGFPGAVAIAAAWTWLRLRDELTEIHIRSADVAVRSVLASAGDPRRLRWFRVIDIEKQGTLLLFTLGLESFKLKLSEWPEREHLVEDLQAAALEHRSGGGKK